MDPLELADRLFSGELRIEEHHPLATSAGPCEVAPATLFVSSFANSIAFDTGDGLVLVDTGSAFTAAAIRDALREWSDEPVVKVIYTHGHVDHVMGAHLYDAEADDKGWARPDVIAHDAVAARFDRYVLTAGYNSVINARQFQVPGLQWPTDYRRPDTVFTDTFSFVLGGETFELTHARGETDDHTWVWIPNRRILCSGDFFIWASPNAGNPQKAQRYPREWAAALREMATRDAKMLLPGHGPPVVGADRVRTVLDDSAALLESLVEQALALMNEGAPLERLLREVRAPEELLDKPYLKPIYDEPEFVVRNIWRLYGGWYDGDPATLKPAPASDVAREIAALAGADRLAARASELADAGELAVACHLIEHAAAAEPEKKEFAELRATIYERRAAREASTMSKGIFRWAASSDGSLGK
ncbi:MAG: alkyl sulfatase dimerization domain-containing protein [Actinomycetota bacterium]